MTAREKDRPGACLEGGDEGQEQAVSVEDPLALLEEEHRHQLELCDILEQIADGLPFDADKRLACAAMTVLRFSMPRHQHTEERALFPILRERIAGDARTLQMLAQLESEHVCDEQLAYEIADELEHLTEHGQPANPDMLGYMLRGFFECQRRHIEWENTVILPLARELLTPEDLDRVRSAVAEGAPPSQDPSSARCAWAAAPAAGRGPGDPRH